MEQFFSVIGNAAFAASILRVATPILLAALGAVIASQAGCLNMGLEGINVVRMRYLAYILSGFLAGIGGAYMSMGYVSWFARDMTSGRGFIALAANAMGRSTPVGTMVASVFFGITRARSNSLQTLSIPYDLVEAVPYVCTIVALSAYAYQQVRKTRKLKG